MVLFPYCFGVGSRLFCPKKADPDYFLWSFFYDMLSNSESSTLTPDESPRPTTSAYRDRLNHWAIARVLSGQTLEVVARFRSYSDAEGRLKFVQRQFPSDRLLVIADKQR